MPSHAEHLTAMIEALNAGDPDRFVELSEGATYHEPATGRTARDDDLKAVFVNWRTAFPDLRGEVVSVVENANTVAGEVSFTGTHSGIFATADGGQIPASGNAVEQTQVLVGHYENGILARMTRYFDALGILRQMGAA